MATLQVLEQFERIALPPDVRVGEFGGLTVEQRQRAVALREAGDVLLGMGPVLADLLVVADYIVTGTQPAVLVTGTLPGATR